jgi:hypothetical protein
VRSKPLVTGVRSTNTPPSSSAVRIGPSGEASKVLAVPALPTKPLVEAWDAAPLGECAELVSPSWA